MKFCGGPGTGEGVHNALLTGIGFAFLWVGWLSHCAGAAAAGGAPVATVLVNAQVHPLAPFTAHGGLTAPRSASPGDFVAGYVWGYGMPFAYFEIWNLLVASVGTYASAVFKFRGVLGVVCYP